MNNNLVKHLDFSENSTLSDQFYSKLGEVVKDRNSVLERIELEDNRIGDNILINLIDDILFEKERKEGGYSL